MTAPTSSTAPTSEVQQQVDRLEGEQVMADTDTAFGWLADHDISADRMGVIGFDLGGSVALLVAAKRTLGAAVTVAGERASPSPRPPACPRWSTPPPASPARGWASTARRPTASPIPRSTGCATPPRRREVATDVVVYPRSGHRFDDDPDAAADAWQRTLNWFDSHLR